MTPSEVQIYLNVTEEDADPERLDELTGRLLRDLRELGAVPVFLPKLVEFLQAWSLRGESQGRRIKIKTPAGLEVEFTPEKKLSQAELVALVENLAQAQV